MFTLDNWLPLLESLDGQVEQVRLDAGERLFAQRDPSDAMYVVAEGELVVSMRGRGESEDQVIARIQPGELAGEIGWLSGSRRSASVDAATDSTLWKLPGDLLPELRAAEHPVLDHIAAVLDLRKRHNQRRLQDVPVADGLTQWWSRREHDARDLDVVLLAHPRHTEDLRLALPWLRQMDDEDLGEVSGWLRPAFGEVMQASGISVGTLFLPRLARHLLDPRRRAEARRIVAQDCVSLARNNGAGVLCLGGLTASLMRYGKLFDDTGDLRITTGHAMTSICCVRTLEAGIDRFDLDTRGRQLTVLGVGSVGAAFTELLLTRERCPDHIVLSDLPGQQQQVADLVERLRPMLASGVTMEAVEAGAPLAADHPVYRSDFVFSATSSAEVIDIDQVAPGTLLVDDSQPHCWNRAAAWERYSQRHDIYPCEAGLIDCSALGYRSFFPFDFVVDQKAGTAHAFCCLTEGLLLSRDPGLQPTLGPPSLESMTNFERAFEEADLRPAPLRCASMLL